MFDQNFWKNNICDAVLAQSQMFCVVVLPENWGNTTIVSLEQKLEGKKGLKQMGFPPSSVSLWELIFTSKVVLLADTD